MLLEQTSDEKGDGPRGGDLLAQWIEVAMRVVVREHAPHAVKIIGRTEIVPAGCGGGLRVESIDLR